MISDEQGMQMALEWAHRASLEQEVPVGAVLVQDGKVLAGGFNCPISTQDPSAHAEIVALRAGAKELENYRLVGTTLYVTLEPCAMCAGAIVQARVARVVFGASDQRAGAVQSVFRVFDESKLNHRVAWEGGILAKDCAKMLQDFFRARR